MTIRMPITHVMYTAPTQENDWTSSPIEKTFNVDLISYDEMDFPDLDLHAMMGAQAVGMPFYDAPLDFYNDYTNNNGFRRPFLAENMEAFYRALQDQGYENFNHGDFSPEQFALILASFIKYGDEEEENRAHYLLEDLVGPDDGYDDDGEPSAFTRCTDKVQERVDELISYLEYAEADAVKEVLDELMLYIDRDQFDYSESEATDKYSENYRDLDFNAREFHHTIKIHGETIYEWDRYVKNEIYDPIHFKSAHEDYGEHSDSYYTPEAALEILKYFGEKEDDYAEGSRFAPDPPDYPVSDKNGEFGVLYQRRMRDYDKGGWSETEFAEEVLVPYKYESNVRDAIELSKAIFYKRGENEWVMTEMKRINDKWYEYGEYEE